MIHAPDCTQKYDPEPCKTCGEAACWHRLDDAANVSPTDKKAKFRCVGVHYRGCPVNCLNFKGEIL